MRLPLPTANEAVSFFRDNWNWIKDRVQDRIDEGQFINGDVAILIKGKLAAASVSRLRCVDSRGPRRLHAALVDCLAWAFL
jgi:hypothetical protein